MISTTLLLSAWLLAAPAQAPSAPAAGATQPGTADAFSFEQLKYVDRVEKDGIHVRTMAVQVRLRTAQGVAEFGQLALPYLEGYGEVRFEDVLIEKEDGRRVPVTNGILEDLNPFGVTAGSLTADLRYKKFTIPGLEPGDRLSYRLVLHHKPLARGRAFGEMDLWYPLDSSFQTYELDLPREQRFKVRIREGASWQELPSAGDRLVRRLVKPPSVGTASEPTLESVESLGDPDVIFTSFDSWDEVGQWWWGISKDRLAPDATVAKEAAALAGAAATPRDKVATLHGFLATRIRYLNVSFGLGRMQPRRAPEVLANRYGDCKDKHALLAALAASLGIDVRPVLINSSRPRLRDDVPSPQQFDHMISVVRLGETPESWLWLDSTNPYAGPGHLVPSLRDKAALLVEKDGRTTMVRTPADPPFVTRHEVSVKGTLSAEGVLRARITWMLHSDAGIMLRSVMAAVPRERMDMALAGGVAASWGATKVENASVSDPLDTNGPFRLEFDVEKTFEASSGERSLRVPFPGFDLPEAESEAAEGTPAAAFPVREAVERAEIELPEGQPPRLPLSVSVDRPFAAFRSSYTVEGRTVKLERTLRLTQPSVSAAESASYAAFRSAVEKDHEQKIAVTGIAMTPATGAVALRDEGAAAFKRRDFAKAAELLRKATELDPKVNGGLVDLGRALCELRKYEEAVAAFSRQVELVPFDEGAYGWRAFALGKLDRWPEAEQDLHKQIEVAPFGAWPYRELGRRRSSQARYKEAAGLYAQAATLEPKEPERWLDLAQQQVLAGDAEAARQSLAKLKGLELKTWMKVQAASVYHRLGDRESAAALAVEALPSVTESLRDLDADDLEDDDTYWVSRLTESWRYIGEAALAAGDLGRAEKYLEAAWRLEFLPAAGWALGELREKQGRLADAVELWSMASGAAGWYTTTLPADRQKRIVAACAKLPDVPGPVPTRPSGGGGAYVEVVAEPARLSQARGRLTQLRTVRLEGPVVADFTERVLILSAADGRVERVLNVSRKSPREFDRQLAQLSRLRIQAPAPDEHAFKAVRRGLLTCYSASGCALVLDLPKQEAPTPRGSIRFTSVDPHRDATLRRGQRVTLVAKAAYDLPEEGASASIVVRSQPRSMLIVESERKKLEGTAGEVTFTASFTVPEDAEAVFVMALSSQSHLVTDGANYPVR